MPSNSAVAFSPFSSLKEIFSKSVVYDLDRGGGVRLGRLDVSLFTDRQDRLTTPNAQHYINRFIFFFLFIQTHDFTGEPMFS